VIHGWDSPQMGKSQRFPVGFPPIIREIIKQQVGILGNSEAEVVKNMVLIYITEKGLLKKFKTEKKKEGRDR
jgi:hypothetical protein